MIRGITLADIQDILTKNNLEQLPELHISIMRNIMLEPIEPYLRYYAYQMGLNARVMFGAYDNVFQEAVDGRDDLLNIKTDFVLVFMQLENLSWDLARNFAGLLPEQVHSEMERIQEYVHAVQAGIRRQTDAMIMWHGFELPVNPALGIRDSQIDTGQLSAIRKLNDFLHSSLQRTVNAYFVDLNLCLSKIGAKNFYDQRYWHIGRAPYTLEALYEIVFEDYKFIRPVKGKNKKCLVLDCDNTLWGGIIGEDGLAGIMLSKNYPGSAYYEFQQEVLNLYNRGVIIALCSKNNETDVQEVFEKHPDMVLKKEHIATAQINWQDKAANLKQIALDLNIGLDSMVFIDDSDFEINLIKNILPEVEVIHLPPNRITEYRDILASCGLFDTLTLSEEDKKRGAMYAAEAHRSKARAGATDLESYFISLEMEVDIRFADNFSIPRLAQQTQKTNQFNLTTKRYNEADIKAFKEDENSDVIYLKLMDKFGNSGIVGTCILKYTGNKALFDTLLLSCRVLGRGVEDVFLVQALKMAGKRGCKLAVGEYYATRKNLQVEYFYSNHGFEEIGHSTGSADHVFHFDLTKEIKSGPAYFKAIHSEIE